MQLTWGASTDTGRVRTRNEDAYLAAPPVFAIADGMGGHEAGDVAAQLAVESLGTLVGRPSVDRDTLLEVVRAANERIGEQAAQLAGGMGTTLVGLAIAESEGGHDRFLVFNIGDSRCYRARPGELERLTHDHSLVQHLVDAHVITPDEAREHPRRNVITRSLSGDPVLDVESWFMQPDRGDRYVICSDGVTDELTDDEVAAAIGGVDDPQVAADAVLSAALDRGGRDNVTVVVLDVVGLDDPALHDLNDDTRPRPRPPLPT
jgi:protein phosphatase